jgi:carbonic anhydrase/acetyltransferase-like protein (isoleucine patch superfamily)
MGDDVVFHALEEADLVVGGRVQYGDKVVVHGGSRVVSGRPEVQTTVGDDVVLKDESVVFRSTIGNGSVIGERSAVVGTELAAGTVVPPRTVILNGVRFGNVEW